MTKYHLKRRTAPKTWPVTRKESTFIMRPRPSGHTLALSMPITIVLREVLGIVGTAKQAQLVMRTSDVKVNGRQLNHKDDPVGFMDVLTVGKDNYRILINKNNVLTVEPVKKGEEYSLHQITGKTSLKGGKTQINCRGGFNILVDKDNYKTRETLVVDLLGKIKESLPFAKGSTVLVIGGAHIGRVGTMEEIDETTGTLTISAGKDKITTSKDYAFVIGKDKPIITING